MKEIVKVKLDNEMDIILAHKRAMKLAELCGCSLVTQTTLATAISEMARCGIESGKNSLLTLQLETALGKKYITGTVYVPAQLLPKSKETLMYARRLVDDMKITPSPKETLITIRYPVNFGGTLTDQKIQSFCDYFEKEPPLSPYDELRRKNQLLQDMAEKIRETESEYKILSDTLPIMMFSASNRGQVTFTNQWLQQYLGSVPKDLVPSSWQTMIHEGDFSVFSRELNASIVRQVPFNGQYRLRQKSTGSFVWHLFSLMPLKNDKEIITGWIGFLVDVNAQKTVEQTLKDNRELKDTQAQLFRYQEELERKVVELNRSNYELEQFAHLASHDLQEPLRKLFFYSDMLKKKYASAIDAGGVGILNNMTTAASRMRELIQDLLSYSQLHKQKLVMEHVSLEQIVEEVIRDLEVNIREKNAVVRVSRLPALKGNPLRLRQLFTNLMSNSLKYSRSDVPPEVDINAVRQNGDWVVSVRDNGIGFDPEFSERIFGLFERLHSRDEFPGTGIGLSICKKIAELHGGSISATSRVNEFSLFEVRFPFTENEAPSVNE